MWDSDGKFLGVYGTDHNGAGIGKFPNGRPSFTTKYRLKIDEQEIQHLADKGDSAGVSYPRGSIKLGSGVLSIKKVIAGLGASEPSMVSKVYGVYQIKKGVSNTVAAASHIVDGLANEGSNFNDIKKVSTFNISKEI